MRSRPSRPSCCSRWAATRSPTTAGWSVHRMEPAALSAKLRPYYRIARPAGEGRFPTALLYSGCDGPKDNLERWAAMLVARRLGGDHRRQPCAARLLGPRGLAADLRRADVHGLRARRRRARLDRRRPPHALRRSRPASPSSAPRTAAGRSWTCSPSIRRGGLPFNLSALPDPREEDPLAGVVGTILLYPYCGTANRAARDGWRRPLPTLFVLSEDDAIADPDDCLRIVVRARTTGRAGGDAAALGRHPRLRPAGARRAEHAASSTRRRPRRRSSARRRLPRRAQNGQMTGTRPTATTKNQSMNGRPNFQ